MNVVTVGDTWRDVYNGFHLTNKETHFEFVHDYGDGTELRLLSDRAIRINLLAPDSSPEFALFPPDYVCGRWVSQTLRDPTSGQLYAYFTASQSLQGHLFKLCFSPLTVIHVIQFSPNLFSNLHFYREHMLVSRNGRWIAWNCYSTENRAVKIWRAQLNPEKGSLLQEQTLTPQFVAPLCSKVVEIDCDGCVWVMSAYILWRWLPNETTCSPVCTRRLDSQLPQTDLFAMSAKHLIMFRPNKLEWFDVSLGDSSNECLIKTKVIDRPLYGRHCFDRDAIQLLMVSNLPKIRFSENCPLRLVISSLRWNEEGTRVWITNDVGLRVERYEMKVIRSNESLRHLAAYTLALRIDPLREESILFQIPFELRELVHLFFENKSC